MKKIVTALTAFILFSIAASAQRIIVNNNQQRQQREQRLKLRERKNARLLRHRQHRINMSIRRHHQPRIKQQLNPSPVTQSTNK